MYKYGHWVSRQQYNAEKHVAFVYSIMFMGRIYIGYKTITSNSKTNMMRGAWNYYSGSSETLTQAFMDNPTEQAYFEIYCFCESANEARTIESVLIKHSVNSFNKTHKFIKKERSHSIKLDSIELIFDELVRTNTLTAVCEKCYQIVHEHLENDTGYAKTVVKRFAELYVFVENSSVDDLRGLLNKNSLKSKTIHLKELATHPQVISIIRKYCYEIVDGAYTPLYVDCMVLNDVIDELFAYTKKAKFGHSLKRSVEFAFCAYDESLNAREKTRHALRILRYITPVKVRKTTRDCIKLQLNQVLGFETKLNHFSVFEKIRDTVNDSFPVGLKVGNNDFEKWNAAFIPVYRELQLFVGTDDLLDKSLQLLIKEDDGFTPKSIRTFFKKTKLLEFKKHSMWINGVKDNGAMITACYVNSPS